MLAWTKQKTCLQGFRPWLTQTGVVDPKKTARVLKFLSSEEEELYYLIILCSKNEDYSASDQCLCFCICKKQVNPKFLRDIFLDFKDIDSYNDVLTQACK